jgi:stress-induced-phosphoprotein 1
MSAGDFKTAVEHYTKAIQHDAQNHVLYSNRSAAFASLKQYGPALDDAEKTVQLMPNWSKVHLLLSILVVKELDLDESKLQGYSRKGAALCYLGRYEDAKAAYAAGLELEPDNEQLKRAAGS